MVSATRLLRDVLSSGAIRSRSRASQQAQKKLIKLDRAKQKTEKFESNKAEPKMIGYLYASTYYKVAAVFLVVASFFGYCLHMRRSIDNVNALLAVNDPRARLAGLKRLSSFYRFALPMYLNDLRGSMVVHNVVALLLQHENPVEVAGTTIGTLGLLFRDPLIADAAVKDRDLLMMLNLFFDSEDSQEQLKVAVASMLKQYLLSDSERIEAMQNSKSGSQVVTHVANYADTSASGLAPPVVNHP
mmetsp:Transcript_10614/g.32471  ORF Transcript_10614/g.32471 Transcript_10614/m.32471 type:complete len:244 (+) Transcript_10614:127-858(+)